MAVARDDPDGSVPLRGRLRGSRSDASRRRRAHRSHGLTDAALLARVRTAVAAELDARALLSLYGDPSRRRLLRERVRAIAGDALEDAAAETLCAELFGFGPIQGLLDDPDVTDVLVNGPNDIWVERGGRLVRTDACFRDETELSDLVHRVAASVGRELTIEQPYVDARMRDGSRANAVIEPVGGPTLSIRKFRRLALALDAPAPSWTSAGALSTEAACFLRCAVRERANILVTGATGSGKSTLLRSLAAHIPSGERLVVIEDTNELVLPHPHVVHLECVPGRDGGGVRVADLVANALRMRPDRLIVGEVRTPRDASALLEALGTGHDGALTTLHAASARDALGRLELLLARAGELGAAAIERHLRRSIDVIVHLRRDPDGRRLVREIAQVTDDAVATVWSRGDAAVVPVPSRWS